MSLEPVSVVLTVLNEAHAIEQLLGDLQAQDQPADEIIVVDGGSTDGTLEAIRRHAAVTLIEAPGANISQGRNRGIEAARNDVVAVTDAGVRLGADWLRLITAPIQERRAELVAGFFQPDPHDTFERAMGATVLPALADVSADTFLPSSRSVAFRKDTWRRVGRYPEWLDYCEDLIFDINARRSPDVRVVFEPRAVARFRPRSSLGAYFRQYYRYARGDGKADLWRKRHAARYVAYAYLLATLAYVLRPAVSPRRRITLALPLLIGGPLYLRTPIRRLPAAPLGETLRMLALVPIIRVVGDVAKMLGYPAGWLWRLRNRPEEWRR